MILEDEFKLMTIRCRGVGCYEESEKGSNMIIMLRKF